MLPIVINLLLAIHIIVSLLIILVVLMQRPKSEGLGAAFGGGMTENLFGAQTTNVLATITRWLGGIFFSLTLLLSVLYAHQTANAKSPIQQQLVNAPKPLAAPSVSPLPSPSSPAPSATAGPSASATAEMSPPAIATPAAPAETPVQSQKTRTKK